MHAQDIYLLSPDGLVLARCPTPQAATELAATINETLEANAVMREAIEETIKALPDSYVMTKNTLRTAIGLC